MILKRKNFFIIFIVKYCLEVGVIKTHCPKNYMNI